MNHSLPLNWYLSTAIKMKPYAAGIHLVWFFLALCFAGVFLLIYLRNLRNEKWVKYMGIAFGLFSIQPLWYVLFPANFWLDPSLALVSYFLLLAAGDLWAPDHHENPWWQPKIRFWGIVAIAIATLFCLMPWLFPLHRLPLYLFSFLCFGAFAWTLSVNAVGQLHTILRWTFFILVTLMGFVLHAAKALNPVFALKTAAADPWAFIGKPPSSMPTLWPLDILVQVAWFAAGLLFFAAPLYLVVRRLIVLSPDGDTLRDVSFEATEYLDPKGLGGLLKAIGDEVQATYAMLSVRLPGRTENLCAHWGWASNENILKLMFKNRNKFLKVDDSKPEFPWIKPLMTPKESVTGLVFENGVTVYSLRLRNDKTLGHINFELVGGMNSILSVPIFYNGAIVAVLTMEWAEPRAFSKTTVRRVEQMVKFMAPAIYNRRLIQGLHHLNPALDRLSNQAKPLLKQLRKLTQVLHNEAHTLATLMVFRLGFERKLVVCVDQENVIEREFEGNGEAEVDGIFKHLGKHEQLTEVSWKHKDLIVVLEEDSETPLVAVGSLAFAVFRDRDPIGNSTIVRGQLHRDEIAARLTNTVFDCARVHFGDQLRAFNRAIEEGPHEVTRWYRLVSDTAKACGIKWTKARLVHDETTKFFGGDKHLEYLLENLPITSAFPDLHINILQLEDPIEDSRCILQLLLPNSGGELYLGLKCNDFNHELKIAASPWKDFLVRFGETADLALSRILALDVHQTVNKAIFNTLFFHELGNLSAELTVLAGRARQHLPRNASEKSRELLDDVRQVAGTFADIAAVLIQPLTMNENGKEQFQLLRMIQVVKEHYDVLFKSRGVSIELKVAPHLETSMSYQAVFVCLSTLLSNALKAMPKGGTIQVIAQGKTATILVHVIDSGPGVPKEHQAKIFDAGFTTNKEDGHGGQGLPNCRKVLKQYGGSLRLDPSHRNGAKFTMEMPYYAPKGGEDV